MSGPLLEVEGLKVEFDTWDGRVRVLDGVSLSVSPGETLGIVGESGCGKSMTALAVMGLVPKPAGHVTGGAIRYRGEDLVKASDGRMRDLRGNRIAMIFQEPMTSLNPVFTVGDQIAETARLHLGLSPAEARKRAVEMLRAVHIPEAERRVAEYPHQFSGGMRQRVMIAMALACEPEVLIADEPTTALDVTVQAQIFDLLEELRAAEGTAIVLITHDMGATAEMADRVVVMYAGRKVEEGPVDAILGNPAHPYTQGLLACRPNLQLGHAAARPQLHEIPGVVPPLHLLGRGCAFADRCPRAMPRCGEAFPPAYDVGESHAAACWLLEEARAA
ncbi:MAG: ABC transporter ATP-binding protein [Burkholderiales bacterium]|nr:ABC transporter ATP-binding protein [Burkholderiales bacterium]